jgi:EAL domain-containing protein (putative c-di-GMP-specific phosphodiesterase class I)/GGDEF domain-containing protein
VKFTPNELESNNVKNLMTMKIGAKDSYEVKRLDALHDLKLLDSAPSEAFDRITRLAAQLFNVPISAVSLTDIDRQWFKSRVGVSHNAIPRDKAPCAQVADTSAVLVIPDLLEHAGYCDSHLAKSGIRFYAGAPLATDSGLTLGAMCVLGTEPREASATEIGLLKDLAGMVMAQIELQHALGRIDPISGQPNRKQFQEDFNDLGKDSNNLAPRLLVMVNLAKHEEVRDSMRVIGSTFIDDYIRRVATKLKGLIGKERTLYHVAEAQFVFFASPGGDLPSYCKKLALLLGARQASAKTRFMTTTSIGIVPFILGEVEHGNVLRMAHSAAQGAFETDDHVCVYSSAQDAAHFRRFSLSSGFATALENKQQLSLVYQPRIDLQSGKCIGAEALLRWTSPTLGPVSPGEFMPLVELSSMARSTTAWVLDTAIGQLSQWHQQGIAIQLSINISASNLMEPDFVERLATLLKRHKVRPANVELELTESAIMCNPSKAQAKLEAISRAGIRLAIDDFGTGYSSLAYLQTLPADVVKIDQTFVSKLFSDPRKQILIKAMVALSHDLDYRVVAEGVETDEAMRFVKSIGCDEAQGYLFAKPMAPEAFVNWIQAPTSVQGALTHNVLLPSTQQVSA